MLVKTFNLINGNPHTFVLGSNIDTIKKAQEVVTKIWGEHFQVESIIKKGNYIG